MQNKSYLIMMFKEWSIYSCNCRFFCQSCFWQIKESFSSWVFLLMTKANCVRGNHWIQIAPFHEDIFSHHLCRYPINYNTASCLCCYPAFILISGVSTYIWCDLVLTRVLAMAIIIKVLDAEVFWSLYV